MDSFSEQVVHEIEARNVKPVPRWHFLVRRSVFWTLAVLSVLTGSISFAVADYVFFDNEGVSTAMILQSPIEDFFRAIPFVWLIAFGLFTISAYLSLRKTRSGYRYRTLVAVLAVVIVAVLFGRVLNYFDFGQGVHYFLLNHTSFYDAIIHSSDDLQAPF